MERIVFIILFFPLALSAQSPVDWWYFGDHAGIHFEQTGPVANLSGNMATTEGVATISDINGQLLFYTDGTFAWNANHDSFGWFSGNSSSTQSAIICPEPGNSYRYYIFTVPVLPASWGLQYSIVDMTLNNGLGEVVSTSSNVPLIDPVCEKVCAVSHANGEDFWIITHKYQTNEVYAYLLTSTGINPVPVISEGTLVPTEVGHSMGYSKVSPYGNMLVMAYEYMNEIELFQFDNETGEATDPIVIPFPNMMNMNFGKPYGLEFSPNGNLLYASPRDYIALGYIGQFNLSTYDSSSIRNSFQLVADSIPIGSLQLGPDGKIYGAAPNQTAIHVISEPNVPGINCDFEELAISLQGRSSLEGLPNLTRFLYFLTFNYSRPCVGEKTAFSFDSSSVDSIHWNFGDPSSGINNTSSEPAPTHIYNSSGSYVVTLAVTIDSLFYSFSDTLTIVEAPSLEIGSDTIICDSEPLLLDAFYPASTYLWSDGSTDSTLIITDDATVWVNLYHSCDTLADTIRIKVDETVNVDIGPDTSFCEGISYKLGSTPDLSATMVWSTGDTVDSIIVRRSSTYTLHALNACGKFSDTVNIVFIPIPPEGSTLLPPDTLICLSESIKVKRPTNDSIQFMWSDSSTASSITLDSSQSIWLTAKNNCGFSIDTMQLIFNPEIQTELGEDTTICDEDSIQLFGTDSLATYLWNTGDTTDTIWTTPGVEENYIVTIKLGLCEQVESIRVTPNQLDCPSIDCDIEYANIFTPNGDGINDRFQLWSSCDIYRFDMAIYNRWGQLVNYSSNIAYGWDGYVNGEPASEGTYYFVVEYKDLVVVDADRQLVRGSFTLSR